MLTAMALLAATPSAEAELRLARMTALYEQVCLRSFPDDKAVEIIMRARNAREPTPEEVKVTMRDDPARGWDLGDGGATLWIEFPPYHACSVRWSAPRVGDLAAYRAIADDYERASGGFHPFPAYHVDREDIHIHAVGEQRAFPAVPRDRCSFSISTSAIRSVAKRARPAWSCASSTSSRLPHPETDRRGMELELSQAGGKRGKRLRLEIGDVDGKSALNNCAKRERH